MRILLSLHAFLISLLLDDSDSGDSDSDSGGSDSGDSEGCADASVESSGYSIDGIYVSDSTSESSNSSASSQNSNSSASSSRRQAKLPQRPPVNPDELLPQDFRDIPPPGR